MNSDTVRQIITENLRMRQNSAKKVPLSLEAEWVPAPVWTLQCQGSQQMQINSYTNGYITVRTNGKSRMMLQQQSPL
jgi:hypothetical protein